MKNLKKKVVATLISLSIVAMFGFVTPTFATVVPADPCTAGGDILGLGCAKVKGLGTNDIRLTIASMISVALGLMGTVVVVIIIWAGFRWMTAGGNSDEVDKAKTQIGQAVIGLAIILSAYSLTYFITESLLNATIG